MLNSHSWDITISDAKKYLARMKENKCLSDNPYAGFLGSMQRTEHQTQNMNNLPALHGSNNSLRTTLLAFAHE